MGEDSGWQAGVHACTTMRPGGGGYIHRVRHTLPVKIRERARAGDGGDRFGRGARSAGCVDEGQTRQRSQSYHGGILLHKLYSTKRWRGADLAARRASLMLGQDFRQYPGVRISN